MLGSDRKSDSTTSSSKASQFVHQEKMFMGVNKDGHTIPISYVETDPKYNEPFLRAQIAEFCHEANAAYYKQIASLTSREAPALTCKIWKVPGDVGFGIKATPDFLQHRYQEFLKKPTEKQKMAEQGDLLMTFFIINDRARKQICEIPGFLDKLKACIIAHKKSFPAKYQDQVIEKDSFHRDMPNYIPAIAKYDTEIEHAYEFKAGTNLKKKEKGWDIEIQHNLYFFLNYGEEAAFQVLNEIFQDSTIQEQVKACIHHVKYEAKEEKNHIGPTITDELQKFIPISDLRRKLQEFYPELNNWTKCRISRGRPKLFDSDHLAFFEKNEYPTRGDFRADPVGRFYTQLTGPLRTAAEGEILEQRFYWAMEHLDWIFHDEGVSSESPHKDQRVKASSPIIPLCSGGQGNTLTVQPSVRTGKSKELTKMGIKALNLTRQLTYDELLRKVATEFVREKLKQLQLEGNKEKEAYYINKIIELNTDEYYIHMADLPYQSNLQKQHDGKISHRSTVVHYKGQAVIQSDVERVKNTSDSGKPPLLIFSIDRSGSMGAPPAPGQKSLMNIVLDAIREQMEFYQEMGINAEIKLCWWDNQSGQLGKSFWTSDPQSMQQLKDLIIEQSQPGGCLVPSGWTSLVTEGYRLGTSLAEPGRKNQLFLFSDGIANDRNRSEYPELAEKYYKENIEGKGIKNQDFSNLAYFLIPELYQSARGYLDDVIAPAAIRNPTAQNVSFPVRHDLIRDQIGATSIVQNSASYQAKAWVQEGNSTSLGILPANNPKRLYSAVRVEDIKDGVTVFHDLGDGVGAKITIPPGTSIREMTEAEAKDYEIHLILTEIELRRPGIFATTETKVQKSNQDFLAAIAEEYTEELPHGARYILENYVLGKNPTAKAATEVGLIEQRASIQTGARATGKYVRRGANGLKRSPEKINIDDEPVEASLPAEGADDMPPDEHLNKYSQQIGQIAAQQTFNGVVKQFDSLKEESGELACTIINKEELQRHHPMVQDEKIDENDPLIKIAENIIKDYKSVFAIQIASLKQDRDNCYNVIDKLRKIRDQGPDEKAKILNDLKQEIQDNDKICGEQIAVAIAPFKEEIQAAEQIVTRRCAKQKEQLKNQIEQKRIDFNNSFAAKEAALKNQLTDLKNELSKNEDIPKLAAQLQKNEKEKKDRLGTLPSELAQKIVDRKKELVNYVSKDEIKIKLLAIYKDNPQEFKQLQNMYGRSIYDEQRFVQDIIDKKNSTDTSNTRTAFAAKPDILKQFNEMISARDSDRFFENDKTLRNLQTSLDNIEGHYDNEHITPLRNQIAAIENKLKKQISDLENECNNLQKNFEEKEIKPLQQQIDNLENSVREELTGPVKKRIKEIEKEIKDKNLIGLNIAKNVLESNNETKPAEYVKHFNEKVLPDLETELAKKENRVDRAQKKMKEIESTLSKAVRKKQIRSFEMYRINHFAKKFQDAAEAELKVGKAARIKENPHLIERQKDLLNSPQIKRLSADKNLMLVDIPNSDIEEELKELAAIRDEKSGEKQVRMFGNGNATVFRLVQDGKILEEIWVCKQSEAKELADQDIANIEVLLLTKHEKRRELIADIQKLISAKVAVSTDQSKVLAKDVENHSAMPPKADVADQDNHATVIVSAPSLSTSASILTSIKTSTPVVDSASTSTPILETPIIASLDRTGSVPKSPVKAPFFADVNTHKTKVLSDKTETNNQNKYRRRVSTLVR